MDDIKETEISKDEIFLFHKQVGANVKKWRIERKMSQLDLSYAMGYKSVGLVSMAEICINGKHFNLEHLYKISKILNIDMCMLIAQEP